MSWLGSVEARNGDAIMIRQKLFLDDIYFCRHVVLNWELPKDVDKKKVTIFGKQFRQFFFQNSSLFRTGWDCSTPTPAEGAPSTVIAQINFYDFPLVRTNNKLYLNF